MNLRITLACSIFALTVFSASGSELSSTPDRESSLLGAFDRNPQGLDSYAFGLNLVVSESARLLADFKRDGLPRQVSRADSARSYSLGLGWDFKPEWTAAFRADYASLPDSVYAKGFDISVGYRLDVWRFRAGFKSLRYTVDRVAGLRDRGIPERSVNLGVSYAWSAEGTLHLSGTRYFYGGATPSELAAVVSNRPTLSVGLLDAVLGFPSGSASLGFGYRLSPDWDVDLTVSSTTYELAARTTSATLSVNDQVGDHWDLGVSGTRLKQDGTASGSIVGLSATYLW